MSLIYVCFMLSYYSCGGASVLCYDRISSSSSFVEMVNCNAVFPVYVVVVIER